MKILIAFQWLFAWPILGNVLVGALDNGAGQSVPLGFISASGFGCAEVRRTLH
jgi:hypothetical protein